MNLSRIASFSLFISMLRVPLLPASLAQTAPPASYPNYPSETPSTFSTVQDAWDYARREVMIPMRDGVRLHTVVLVPKGAKNAPILLTRTPTMLPL